MRELLAHVGLFSDDSSLHIQIPYHEPPFLFKMLFKKNTAEKDKQWTDHSSSLRTGEQGTWRTRVCEDRGEKETYSSLHALLYIKYFFDLVQSIFLIHEFPICRFAYWLRFICNTKVNTHVC